MAKAKSGNGKVTLSLEDLELIFIRHSTDEERLAEIVELAAGSKEKAENLSRYWRLDR